MLQKWEAPSHKGILKWSNNGIFVLATISRDRKTYAVSESDISDDISLNSDHVSVEFDLHDRLPTMVRKVGKPFRRGGVQVWAAASRSEVEYLLGTEPRKALEKLLDIGGGARYFGHSVVRTFLKTHVGLLNDLPLELWSESSILTFLLLLHPEVQSQIEGASPDTLIGALQARARFASSELPSLRGTCVYSSLSPEDFYLGASYCRTKNDSPAMRSVQSRLHKLESRNDWDWPSISGFLSKPEGENRDLNLFLALGMQPRIAELAFAEVCRVLDPGGPQPLDLNLQAVQSHGSWSLKNGPALPPDDWLWRSHSYDVKSNIYFRSFQQGKLGLKGFLIDFQKEKAGGRIPGIVFYDSSDDGCSWSFVGVLEVREKGPDISNNVVPAFHFKMPAAFRAPPSKGLDRSLLLDYAREISHREEPSLKSVFENIFALQCLGQESSEYLSEPRAAVIEQLLLEKSRLDVSEAEIHEMPLERMAWEAATRLVFRIRSSWEAGGEALVEEALVVLQRTISSPWFPKRMAEIGEGEEARLLLADWIENVLLVLNSHWEFISCPICGGEPRIDNLRQNGEGTILGRFACNCGLSRDATLIANCFKCNKLLVIGQRRLCSECFGLVCRNTSADKICGSCKCSKKVKNYD